MTERMLQTYGADEPCANPVLVVKREPQHNHISRCMRVMTALRKRHDVDADDRIALGSGTSRGNYNSSNKDYTTTAGIGQVDIRLDPKYK